jgi:hypothetical protein
MATSFVACGLNLNLYEASYKRLSLHVYKGFYIKPYKSQGKDEVKYYLCAQGYEVHNPASFTAPSNALVYLAYSTGSRKHTYHSFTQWFIVKQGSKAALEFNNEGCSKVNTENLEPLPPVTDKTISEVEAEILNLGLIPSQYDPVRSIYYYVVKHLNLISPNTLLNTLKPDQTVTIPFTPQPQPSATQQTQDIAAQIAALKAAIEQKRKELELLEKQLQSLLLKQGLEQLKEAVV